MSGVTSVLMTSGRGRINATTFNVGETNVNPGLRTARRTFNDDGTTSKVGTFGVFNNWWTPPTTGIGASWWVRYTVTTSSLTTQTGMTSGTWYSLSSAPYLNFQNSGTAAEGTGSGTIDFSPDNGTTVVPGGSISWDVGYTP